MVGLVKAVLCLWHGEVPPNLHCATLNPRLEDALRRCPMAFPRDGCVPLPGGYAGVSSFGLGGTNSHVVVTRALDGVGPEPREAAIEWHRVPLPWGVVTHPLIGTCEKKGHTRVWVGQWDLDTVQFLLQGLQSGFFLCFDPRSMVHVGVSQLDVKFRCE